MTDPVEEHMVTCIFLSKFKNCNEISFCKIVKNNSTIQLKTRRVNYTVPQFLSPTNTKLVSRAVHKQLQLRSWNENLTNPPSATCGGGGGWRARKFIWILMRHLICILRVFFSHHRLRMVWQSYRLLHLFRAVLVWTVRERNVTRMLLDCRNDKLKLDQD